MRFSLSFKYVEKHRSSGRTDPVYGSFHKYWRYTRAGYSLWGLKESNAFWHRLETSRNPTKRSLEWLSPAIFLTGANHQNELLCSQTAALRISAVAPVSQSCGTEYFPVSVCQFFWCLKSHNSAYPQRWIRWILLADIRYKVSIATLNSAERVLRGYLDQKASYSLLYRQLKTRVPPFGYWWPGNLHLNLCCINTTDELSHKLIEKIILWFRRVYWFIFSWCVFCINLLHKYESISDIYRALQKL